MAQPMARFDDNDRTLTPVDRANWIAVHTITAPIAASTHMLKPPLRSIPSIVTSCEDNAATARA